MASLKGGVESWTGRNWAVRKRGGNQSVPGTLE